MQGPGLAFPAFSQAISVLPGAPFWAFLFFLALLLMQLTTLVKLVESIVYPLHNSFSAIRKHPTLLPGMVAPHSGAHPALLPSPPQATPISRARFGPLTLPYPLTSTWPNLPLP